MTDPIETLVREAQRRQAAATTPDLARIRGALPALRRRRDRRRRTGFALATLAVVVAVVAIVRLPGGTPGARNEPAGPPATSPASTRHDPRVAMPYELVDPPGAYRERLRTIEEGPDGTTATRTYQERALDPLATAPEGRHITLSVRPGGLPGGEGVVVGSVRGVYEQLNAADARVTWPARLGGVVALDAVGTGLSRGQVVHLAESVRDLSLWHEKLLVPGWTPGKEPRMRYTQSLIDADRSAATVTADASAEGGGVLTASLAPATAPGTAGEFASLHAQPADLTETTDGWEIVQTLPDSAFALTVRFARGSGPPMSKADFLAAAEAVEVRG